MEKPLEKGKSPADAQSASTSIEILCFIPDGTSGAAATPCCGWLCVRLLQKSELAEESPHLLDRCLNKVGSIARTDLNPTWEEHGATLRVLHRKAKKMGMDGFAKQVEHTVEGAVGAFRAIGVGKDAWLRERAFWLAVSASIILQLEPVPGDMFETIFNVYEGAQQIVQEARDALDTDPNIEKLKLQGDIENIKALLHTSLGIWVTSGPTPTSPTEVLNSLSLDVNGHRFIIVSDRADFMQGRCTTSESYKQVTWVHHYLKAQKCLLLDFQGEMMGHAGEIYFAVIKATHKADHQGEQMPSSELCDPSSEKLRETECPDGLPDSTAFATDPGSTLGSSGSTLGSTIHTLSGIPPDQLPAAECSGFILDMQSQANIEVINEVLANGTMRKVCWGCEEAMEGLIHQEHPIRIKAHSVENLVDAQKAFSLEDSLGEQRLLPLCEAMKRLKHQILRSKSERGQECQDRLSIAKWAEEDWERFQLLLKPPDWDSFHAANERAVRRPFSQSFLKHSAAEVLDMEAMVEYNMYNCSETWSFGARELTRSLISAVQEDKDGTKTLGQLRGQALENPSPDSKQARATAVKYFRHFARVHSASDTLQELMKDEWHEKYKQVCMEFETWIKTWISSDMSVPQMPFQGDEVHDLICKVLRNLKLATEDTEGFKAMVDSFFPRGVSICRFTEVEEVEKWKAQLEERIGYRLKQDPEAFFLESGFLDQTTNLRDPKLFGHLNFPSGNKRSSKGPGAWWGLPKDVWNRPDAQTQQRALQAIAWIFFSQVSTKEKSWTHFHHTFAIVACSVPQLRQVGTIRPKQLWVTDRRLSFRRVSPDTVYSAVENRRGAATAIHCSRGGNSSSYQNRFWITNGPQPFWLSPHRVSHRLSGGGLGWPGRQLKPRPLLQRSKSGGLALVTASHLASQERMYNNEVHLSTSRTDIVCPILSHAVVD
eukprot:s327_g7.t1